MNAPLKSRILQIEDRKDNRNDDQQAIGAYYDRAMRDRSDNGALDYLSEEPEDQ